MKKLSNCKAIIYMLLYSISSATLAAIIKFMLSSDIHVGQVLFITYLSATLSMVIWYSSKDNWPSLRTQYAGLQCSKAIFGFLQIFWLFLAFKSTPITNALLLRGTAPLFVPILAYYILPSDKYKTKWTALFICFAGLCILLHPQYTQYTVGIPFAISSALFLALNIVVTKRLNNLEEPQKRTLFFSLVLPTLIVSMWEVFAWQPVLVKNLLLLVLSGGLLFLTIQFFISSYKNVSSKFITPFSYSVFLIAVIYDWLFFKEAIDLDVILGGGIIIFGFYINQL